SYARTKESRPLPLKNAGFGCLICCLFTLIAFGNFSGPLLYTLIALLSTLMLFGLFACGKLIFAQKINYSSIGGTLIIYVLPILFANLLANLKRGPWLGVVLGVCLMTLLVTGKRFYSCIPIALAIGSLAIQPVYQRIIHSYDHFFITGGRHLLWQIGIELSTRFPLGIGYDNSRIVKTFSPNIPHELEHFHNNMINLLVETGYVGLCLFAWWLLSIWRFSFSTKRKIEQIVPISIGCAILSWQIAGIVEYNVGDSEITILIFLLIGLLLGSKRAQGQPTAL
ncbi:MAG: O-antigen ligase family protein, partial [Bdellovibrionales bacterium]|nr:O-antigen ligase family protein [Bdellovibrionales bacterium]